MTAEKRLPHAFKRMLDGQVKYIHGTTEYEVIDWVKVLHFGWEGDNVVVLVRLPDGNKEIVIADDTGLVVIDLEERITVYEDAIEQTKALLRKYKEV